MLDFCLPFITDSLSTRNEMLCDGNKSELTQDSPMKLLLVQLNESVVWNAAWKQDWIKLFSLLRGKIAQLGYVLSNTKYVMEAQKKSLIPAEISFCASGLPWMLISKWNLKVSCNCEFKARDLFTETLKNWNYSFLYYCFTSLCSLCSC